MIFYSEHITSRVEYVVSHFFSLAGMEVKITGDLSFFLSSEENKISYSFQPVATGIPHIVPHGLLFEKNIHPVFPSADKWEELNCFFKTSSEGKFPFDIFSATFFLITRYEEYLSFTPDQHGRFPASQSWMGKHRLLHLPLTDQWAKKFSDSIRMQFPSEKITQKEMDVMLTVDVDNAWAYLNKGFLRTRLSGFRSWMKENASEKQQRKNVLAGNEKDPYDTYDYILQHSGNVKRIFFFLFSSYTKYDKNVPVNHPQLAKLIRELARHAEIGTHPSYYSKNDPAKIKKEKSNLEKVAGQPVINSRQHYLRFDIPDTFSHLEKTGIVTDFSMAFADHYGFRAGTSRKFPLYNLKEERITKLQIQPSSLMDATLNYYCHFNPGQAEEISLGILAEIKKTGGTACLHWHNESLSGRGVWKGWEKVFFSQLDFCRK
ncbi:MAG: polysaccharide deacetylase family protein [Bacteroidota bacterium]